MAEKQVPVGNHLNEIARIPAGVEVKDAIFISSTDVRIDGSFHGKILAKGKIIFGEQSTFTGDIVCMDADISGHFEGNIVVGNVLSLLATCAYKGVIKVCKLSVETGAKFDGTCKMITSEEYAKALKDFEASIAGNKNPELPLEKEKKLSN